MTGHIATETNIKPILMVFQGLMDKLLVNVSEFCSVNIDDVLKLSQTWEVHLIHLRRVFSLLKKHSLTCKPSKCQFEIAKIEFLGHVIGSGSINYVPQHRIMDMAQKTIY